MKYYSYARVSTDTQRNGYGLDAQRIAAEKYASDHGLTITMHYADEGVSGNLADDAADDAINKRVALMGLLNELDEGDAVIVLNTSRLWRSDLTKVIVRRELIRRKAKLISIEQPTYDLYAKDPNDFLINSIMEILDAYERMTISAKLSRGRTVKANKGDKPAGLLPYGYEYTPDKKHVQIVPEEAEAVRLMFTLSHKGQSLERIAVALTDKEYAPPRGKSWNRGSVYAILRNPFYTGILQHQGKEIPGNHPAIISKVLFGKVAAQLSKRRKRTA